MNNSIGNVFLFFLFNLIVVIVHAQRLDTINWGGSIIVTDLQLRKEYNCFQKDTVIVSHDCVDNYYQGTEVWFYKVDPETCDSIYKLKSADLIKMAFRAHINSQDNKPFRLRLIRDVFFQGRTFYSPEILFFIQLKNKEFGFTSFETDYCISLEYLKKYLMLKERVPNALKNFSFLGMDLTVFSKDSIKKIEFKGDLIKFFELKKILKSDIEKVRVDIYNTCRDTLKMNFHINK